jgi:hypothetical protein
MTNPYWIKDETRKEVITKIQIPNKANFNLFATYFNLIDKNGLSFRLNENLEFKRINFLQKTDFIILHFNLEIQKSF